MPEKHVTLLFLLRDNEILLAMKKRGFGAGRWNGVGGKIETGESIEDATARECREEIGVKPYRLEKVANIIFQFPEEMPDLVAHVYTTSNWEGEPFETEEMAPRWFAFGDIPYSEMWQDDQYWLPHVLEGKKLHASFAFSKNEEMLTAHNTIEFVEKAR